MRDLNDVLMKSLSIEEPYYIKEILIDDEKMEIDIVVDIYDNKSMCPMCHEEAKLHDKKDKKWRHTDVANYKVYVEFKTPRVRCESHGVKLVDVNWAEPRCHFTKSMEKYITDLSKDIPMIHVGKMVGIHDTQVKRIIRRNNEEI